jgi:hypothetical protein
MSGFINKDGKRYLFKSKYKEFNHLYSLTPSMKKIIDSRLESQREFLKRSHIEIDGNFHGTLFDIAKGANINPKQYHAEIYTRVDTLQKYAHEKGFNAPVFITLTPPSYFKPLKAVKIKGRQNSFVMVDNPNFCGDLNYVKAARDYLSEKWRKFLNQRIFTEIKNEYGERPIFMKTYEPFMDGTPHVHIMVFVPEKYKERFARLVQGYFNESKTDVKTEFEGDVKGVVAYILKYILKSFMHAKEGVLDDVAYWYIYNRIMRFSSSRVLLPLGIHRLISHKEDFQDYLQNTHLFKAGDIEVELYLSPHKFLMKEDHQLESKDYQICHVKLYTVEDGYQYFEYLYKKSFNVTLNVIEKAQKVTFNIVKKEEQKNVEVLIKDKDGHLKHTFILNGNTLKEVYDVLSVTRMKDYYLYQLWQKLEDDERCNPHRYGLVKNEMINRGLLDGESMPLDDYKEAFEVF